MSTPVTLEQALANLAEARAALQRAELEAVEAARREALENTPPPLYTLKQVEEMYGGAIKASTLRALILSGELDYVRYGQGAYLLTTQHLREAVERLTHKAQPRTARAVKGR